MNNVTITDGSGNVVVIAQDDVVTPKWDCGGCMTPSEYVRRIAEYGITTVVNNDDGTYTNTHLSARCICSIEFTADC